MNKRNYFRELETIINRKEKVRPRVLLHACCGPCSSSVVEYLAKYFDISIFWFNPNIFPEDEFIKREKTLEELIDKMGFSDSVPIIHNEWQNERYEDAIYGFEQEPEGGKRCDKCFRIRLLECAEYAKINGFDYFCTTLTVSRHKDAELINSIGEEISNIVGIPWLPNDFKKHNGENRSNELADYYGIYRQSYCGCRYSLEARRNYNNAV